MFNLMVVVINKQINKVFYCFDPNFARNTSIIAGNIQRSSLHSKIKLPIWPHLSDCRS